MRKLFLLAAILGLALSAYADLIILRPGEKFEVGNAICATPVGVSYSSSNLSTIVMEVCRLNETRGRLVVKCNNDVYTYYVKRGDTMYMWGYNGNMTKFAFYDAKSANSTYNTKQKYTVTTLLDNFIEFTPVKDESK